MKKPALPLLPWQRQYIEDENQFKLLVAGRQSGKSYGMSLEGVLESLKEKGSRLSILLSRGERQSLELMEKIRMHTQLMGAAVDVTDEFFESTSILQHKATFPNGKRIIALPANPDTARGYSGDIYLDEFGLHKDSREIWAALFPVATRGYKVRVASTFKGTDNKFYELAKDLGLHTGLRPGQQPVETKGWTGHWVDIYMCAEQGAKVNPEKLRQALDDEEVWLQEFCNVPMSGADGFIPLDLVLACESVDAAIEWDGKVRTGLCAGYDVARKRDASVIVIGEPAADLAVVRGVIWLDRMTFADQKKMAREVAAAVEAGGGRFAMDATGIGAQLAEELNAEFPCVEPVQFAARTESGGRTEEGKEVTVPVKERMAMDLKRRFEQHTLRIPESPRLRRACQAVKRYVGPTGALRFDAPRTDQGHADEFWALALMVAAMTGPRNYVPASECGTIGAPVTGGMMERVF